MAHGGASWRSRDGQAARGDDEEAQRTRDAFRWQPPPPPTGIDIPRPSALDDLGQSELPDIQVRAETLLGSAS